MPQPPPEQLLHVVLEVERTVDETTLRLLHPATVHVQLLSSYAMASSFVGVARMSSPNVNRRPWHFII